MRSRKSLTVVLGEQQRLVDARVSSGAYASPSAVVRAGLKALEREEAELDALVGTRVAEALQDSRPAVPAEDVFAALEDKHGRRAASRRP